MKVGIIGGGVMGICLGYFLSKKDIKVEIFEADPAIGGLAGSMTLEDGTRVDRFYHTILSSDHHMRKLCEELCITNQLRFHETKTGFFFRGKIYSMNNIVEFLKFPPLGWIDRFRLGITVLSAQLIRDWHNLENISIEKWLLDLGGRRTYENIWKPMLNAKFDGSYENTRATWIWARLVRMKSTRSGASQKEEAGYLVGGYAALIRMMAERIQAAGGRVYLSNPVTKIIIEQKKATGIMVDDKIHNFDKLIFTAPVPVITHLIPEASSEYRDSLSQIKYLGIICPLLVMDRPLTGYWTLNLTDNNLPFTGVIETTAYIDPQYVGGHYLLYLPKYTTPDNPLQQLTDEEIKEIWLKNLETMFPEFDRHWIQYFIVHRAHYVEPLHPLKGTHFIPQIKTPIKNLYLATSAQLYPTLTNGESISHMACEVTELIVDELH